MMPSQRRVDDYVRAASKTQPERIAVKCEHETASYAQLDVRVAHIAQRLQRGGVARGDFVGVMLHRSIDMIAALLAIGRVGAAYVPLDPLYPPERCAMMLEDSEARALVTTEDLAASFGAKIPDATAVIVLRPADATAACETRLEEIPWQEGDLAYVIFTSGSTGRPKGVPIYHSSLMNLLESFRQELGASSSDTMLAVTTICFDIAGLEMYLPLVTGATLQLSSRAQTSDPAVLADLIHSSEATIMQATPTAWRMLLRNGWRGCPALTALCGGEAMPPDLMEDLIPCVRRLYNVYGPTETTIWSTCWRCVPGRPVSIGAPLLNTTAYVYNEDLQPVPAGEVGTLWLGGAGLSPGYLNRPDLDVGKFITNPQPPFEVIYDSGDLARTSPDGSLLFCCGRKDLQVKLRGYRIEVEEIAAILKQHPLVADCCVDLKSPADAPDDPQLVAYIVARSSNEIVKLAQHRSEDLNTQGRFAKVCHRSLARIGSILDSGDESDGSDANIDADLEEINNWGAIYDEAYSSQNAANSDPSLNFSGYDNSYTPRVPHQIPVVREWVETTCDRIKALAPRRALEMGCGQGMIMLRCARFTPGRYIAADLSQYSVNYCRQILDQDARFDFPHVSMDVAGAHEALKYADADLDTVICNGVSMYFPSADYLLSVVGNSVAAVQGGGAFFLGDVRANTLFPHFHASVQLFQAAEDMPLDELREKVRHSVRFEKEFLVDPDLFLALAHESPDVAEVRLDMKRGAHHSEFSKFRYDVTFRKARDGFNAESRLKTYSLAPYDADAHSEAALRRLLTAPDAPEVLAISDVPDARTVVEAEVIRLLHDASDGAPRTCRELRQASETAAARRCPVEPELLYRLGEEAGYRVEMMWGARESCLMDVLFVRGAHFGDYETVAIAARRAAGAYPPVARPDWATFTSKAVDVDELFAGEAVAGVHSVTASERTSSGSGQGDDPLQFSLAEVREWKGMLRMCVPEYMVPAVYKQLPALPLTQNGKVDRKALPAPTAQDARGVRARDMAAFRAPVGETQVQLALMFGELLHLDDVAADDDFFEAGGHSLLAMQLVTSISRALGVRLPIARLADASSVEALAAVVDQLRAGGGGGDEDATSAPARRDNPQTMPQVNVEVQPVDKLPHAFTLEHHVPVPMDDDIVLSAKLWTPQGAQSPGPAIVEVNPYRKGDATAEIDALTFPYLAGHGFACLRVDSRGCGDSEGTLDDEYSARQIQDAAAVVEWAAAQPWCSGAVVMLGVSWSGFLALQVAASGRAPAALRGVISVCATDDRAEDDMHFQGGALLFENLSWGAWLMHTLSQPPDPSNAGAEWREVWRQRLDAIEPLAPRWLAHAHDAAYWAHGSVKHAYDAIRVPMLLLGGMHGGGYHNSVARMARGCRNAPVRAVVGPWSHNMPHVSPLGPQAGFLQDVVDYMRSVTDAGATPRTDFCVFSEAPSLTAPLANAAATLVGRWLAFSSVDAADAAVKAHTFVLSDNGALALRTSGASPGGVAVVPCTLNDVVDATQDADLDASPCAGLAAGRWFTFGAGDDMATDQASEDAAALAFDCEPVEEDTAIIGQPEVDLTLVDGATCDGVVVARLCAVAPNRVSHRITWGVLNVATAARTTAPLTVRMNYTCYTLPKGYTLRLALTRDYFPLVWPSLRPAALAPLPIRKGACELRCAMTPCSGAAVRDALERAAGGAVNSTVIIPTGEQFTRTEATPARRRTHAAPAGGVIIDVTSPAAKVTHPSYGKPRDAQLQVRTETNESYAFTDAGERLQARHDILWDTALMRDDWHARCRLKVSMVGEGADVVMRHQVEVQCNGEDVAKREWAHTERW